MIISASRRTDIPAFYSEWFFNRLKEGYALIPNPRNPGRLGRVELTINNVDCIVFWTKNPSAIFDKLWQLDSLGYCYYIQFTLTPYDKGIETDLLPKPQLLQAFLKMSKQIGAHRSVWRYDPIIIDSKHPVEWHIERFTEMCGSLQNYTERCFISFVDLYKSLSGKYSSLTNDEMITVASGFSKIANTHGITLYTCAEEIDLSGYGVEHGACIDQKLIEKIIGQRITVKNDTNQRTACCCIESIDIGAYDTCSHGCSYCYATSNKKAVLRRMAVHDPKAPMLTGYPAGTEIITDRTIVSQKNSQLDFNFADNPAACYPLFESRKAKIANNTARVIASSLCASSGGKPGYIK